MQQKSKGKNKKRIHLVKAASAFFVLQRGEKLKDKLRNPTEENPIHQNELFPYYITMILADLYPTIVAI